MIGLLVAGPAMAAGPAPAPLLGVWTPAQMKTLAQGMGLTVTQDAILDNGDPVLAVRSAAGTAFVIQGAACESARCRGATLMAFVTYDTPAKAQEALKRLDFAAVQVRADEPKVLTLSRYVVFDGGIHRDNLRAQVELFLAVVEQARGLM
ncbi:hypothetical protein [Caulobacter sp. NIBR1757]|uniref:hypothetical protein n=1 Tax=Caulobacter sp. NIBR1757 TaxID=3016000 RepID=UPI0022F00611|nr:hypothetical protein [Caulobacter sp. NIBR1757]